MKKHIEEYIQELEQTNSAQAILRTYQQVNDQQSLKKKSIGKLIHKSHQILELEFRQLKQKYQTLEQELSTLREDYEHAIAQLVKIKPSNSHPP